MIRKILSTGLVITAIALSVPTLAKSRGFSSEVNGTVTTPVKIEITLSEDLAHRAENLPDKLSDRRTSSTRSNSGFGNNGYYGERELNRLTERLQRKLETRFSKKGISISENAPTTLRLVITDAQPSRPTFEQLSRETSLSAFSRALGGAEFDGQIIGPNGQDIGKVSYRYFEDDLFNPSTGAGIWSDANRAIDRFSNRLAKFLTQQASAQ